MRPDLIEYGPLMLNLETYQAAVAGRVLDLTYMEYELLRFLAGHPAKVFTRETLLSRVWGYEYYGGAARSTSTSGASGQIGRGARPSDPDRALGGVPLRPGGLASRTEPAQRWGRRQRGRRQWDGRRLTSGRGERSEVGGRAEAVHAAAEPTSQ